MSAKPYGDEAVGVLIRVLRGERVSELENETTFEWGEDTNARIAATLNALKARLAAAEAAAATAKVAAGLMRDRAEKAEARAEVAVALLVDAKEYVEHCGAEGLLDRIAALLKEVPHGQQG